MENKMRFPDIKKSIKNFFTPVAQINDTYVAYISIIPVTGNKHNNTGNTRFFADVVLQILGKHGVLFMYLQEQTEKMKASAVRGVVLGTVITGKTRDRVLNIIQNIEDELKTIPGQQFRLTYLSASREVLTHVHAGHIPGKIKEFESRTIEAILLQEHAITEIADIVETINNKSRRVKRAFFIDTDSTINTAEDMLEWIDKRSEKHFYLEILDEQSKSKIYFFNGETVYEASIYSKYSIYCEETNIFDWHDCNDSIWWTNYHAERISMRLCAEFITDRRDKKQYIKEYCTRYRLSEDTIKKLLKETDVNE